MFFVLCCCFAVTLSVLTSEALFPWCSSWHPYCKPHTRLISYNYISTGEDIWLSLRCHQKETPHCCQATSVMFSDACSDSTYAGRHLLCLLLTTVLSRSQTEWASPPECRSPLSPSIIPPAWNGGLSDIEDVKLFKFWRNHNFKIKFFHSRWPVSLTQAHFFFLLSIAGKLLACILLNRITKSVLSLKDSVGSGRTEEQWTWYSPSTTYRRNAWSSTKTCTACS